MDEPQPKKDGRRFARVRIGDTVVCRHYATLDWKVTDMWFDPVRGQRNPRKGEMVGIAPLYPDGRTGLKRAYSKTALAHAGFNLLRDPPKRRSA